MHRLLHPVRICSNFSEPILRFGGVSLKMSHYSKEFIEKKLKNELETTFIEVEDLSDGCGAKFNAIIVSPKFDGKPLLQRHRMVNAVLEEEMKTIHAFTQKTLTPEQWEKQQPA